jgi:hypothetical protein
MKTSDITTPRERPASVLANLYYRQQPYDYLAAVVASSTDFNGATPVRNLDTSVYEFPGDRTYARYLSSKAVW